MNPKICSECGTQNEEEYIYCKNCGAPLAAEKTPAYGETENYNRICGKCGAPNPDTHMYCRICGTRLVPEEPPIHNSAAAEEQSAPVGDVGVGAHENNRHVHYDSTFNSVGAIEGIPIDDLAAFIGRKTPDILPKFSKMELTGSKLSWCWPAAILGFLLGPFGSAIWFFYRKMYKPAIFCTVFGVLLSVSNLLFNIDSNIAELIKTFFGETLLDFAIPNTKLLHYIGELIDWCFNIASCTLSGLFGYYLYKRHCVKLIYNFKMNNKNPNYYKLGLASLGGTSGGMAAAGVFIGLGAAFIAEIIVTIIGLIILL